MALTREERDTLRRAVEEARRQQLAQPIGVEREDKLIWELEEEAVRMRHHISRLQCRVAVLQAQLKAKPGAQGNQHGPFRVYASEEDRREARRLTWRLAKRRAYERQRVAA